MSSAPCLNCGTPLAGRWCHACGQDSRDPVRELGALVAEAFDSIVGWDSRLARTLRLLFGDPGALAEAFVSGRRAAYVGPVRLYLVASVAFFATYSLVVDPIIAMIAGGGEIEAGVEGLAAIDRWLPMMMIVILPATAAILHLALGRHRRPFLATQVLILHFGTISFLTVPVAHLAHLALERLGAGDWSVVPTVGAHALNASYLWLMVRRFYRGAPTFELLARMVAASGVAALMLYACGRAVGWLVWA